MDGMSLNQLIAMLMAAKSQGATVVAIGVPHEHGLHECTGVDWVSPEPVDGVVYIAPMPTKHVLSNEAAESLDW